MGVLALGLLVAAALRRRRRRRTPRDESLADIPLVVDSLVKTYSDGHRAVDDVSWRAERGQVVGLLGPNGAGKTTTLRMVMGLIRPDSGAAHVLGDRVEAGSPVLARVGALIEGPGFLPHLTGMDNLRAYWAATGRDDAEAGYDEVLEVAALGGAVDRPVRTYSHGHAATAGHRAGDARPARGAGARRTHQRPRPAADRRAATHPGHVRRRRPHRGHLQPPALRGRADLHPRRGDARRPGRHHRAPSPSSSTTPTPP